MVSERKVELSLENCDFTVALSPQNRTISEAAISGLVDH